MGVTQSEKMAATALRTSCELTFISSTNNLSKGRIAHKRDKPEKSTQEENQGHLRTRKRYRREAKTVRDGAPVRVATAELSR